MSEFSGARGRHGEGGVKRKWESTGTGVRLDVLDITSLASGTWYPIVVDLN